MTEDFVMTKCYTGKISIANQHYIKIQHAGQEPTHLAQLKQHLPKVVKQTQQQMTAYRQAFETENRPKLNTQLAKLEALEHKQVKQLDIFLENSKRHKDETEAIRSRFEEYRHWIQETINTEDQPYIQIIAALVHA